MRNGAPGAPTNTVGWPCGGGRSCCEGPASAGLAACPPPLVSDAGASAGGRVWLAPPFEGKPPAAAPAFLLPTTLLPPPLPGTDEPSGLCWLPPSRWALLLLPPPRTLLPLPFPRTLPLLPPPGALLLLPPPRGLLLLPSSRGELLLLPPSSLTELGSVGSSSPGPRVPSAWCSA